MAEPRPFPSQERRYRGFTVSAIRPMLTSRLCHATSRSCSARPARWTRPALDSGKLARYVCDFPEPMLLGRADGIATPHIGASTEESEENCAVMAANLLIDVETRPSDAAIAAIAATPHVIRVCVLGN